MKHTKFAKSVLAIIATVAIDTSGAVLADETDELKGKSVKVSYEDLNVEKESGAHALYRRLQHASKTACGVEPSKRSKTAYATSESYRCYREALAASVRKVNKELVTRIHEET